MKSLTMPFALTLSTLALVTACSVTSDPAPANAQAPGPSAGADAGASDTNEPDAGVTTDASADAGALSPELLVVSTSQSPNESCDAFCASRKTTCATSCVLPSKKTGAGYVTDVVDLDGRTKTTEYASCSEKLVSAPGSVGTSSKCCCLTTPAQTVTKTSTSPSSCDAQCRAAGLGCDSGGYVTFSRQDGTTCGRAVACSETVSPTSACAQKPSVGASLACTCR
jgi:hypothetical protein